MDQVGLYCVGVTRGGDRAPGSPGRGVSDHLPSKVYKLKVELVVSALKLNTSINQPNPETF